jgi:diguanylate cyclase (GGDEF)-like protein
MPGNSIPGRITRALVEEHIERRSLRLKFAPSLEAFFEEETGKERCRYLVRIGLITLVIFQFVLYPERLLLGAETFPRVLLIQLGITTPLALLFKWFISLNPRPQVREFLVPLIALLATGNCVWLTLISHSHDRWAMLLLLTIAFLYITAIQRARFLQTVIACAGICFFEVFLTLHLPLYNTYVFPAAAFITVTASVFAIYGNYMAEKQTRRAYLLSLLTRIQNAELNHDSVYDALTGLGNRRLLSETIAELESRNASQIAPNPPAVLMLDIDHFKKLNDEAGHLAGDQCLMRIASLIQSQLRSHGDHAFRYGGEEFVILLSNAPGEIAFNVAERIRVAIESAGIPNPGIGAAGTLTASIGVATGNAAIDLLLAAADTALYAAKRAGRNQVKGNTGIDSSPQTTSASLHNP